MKRLGFLVISCVAVVGVSSAGAQNAKPTPTFTKDVAPILYKSCVTCHRPGEVAPMSLISYQDARPWSKAIRQKVTAREMPPWGADSSKSLKFKNDRSLSQAEIDTIAAWVDGGSPKGDDSALPAVPTFAEGWKSGEPDYVITMPTAYNLPAEGEIEMQDFYMKNPLTEDKWVEALEIRPNTAVVHHGNAYIVQLPEGAKIDQNSRAVYADGKPVDRKDIHFGDGTPDPAGSEGRAKLLSYVPGRGYERYAEGVGKKLPANATINWAMHYQPSGKPEVDQAKLGLYWSKGKVTHEIVNSLQFLGPSTYIAEGKEVGYENPDDVGGQQAGLRTKLPNIPPYADNWKMVSVTAIPEDVTMYGLTPHFHLRGKSMVYSVTYPDGREQTMLTVPRYDFNWQLYYDLEQPFKIPAGSKLTVVALFDNSLKNPYNPAPEKEVFWSEQSWDEMYSPQIRAVIDSRDISKTRSNTQQQQQ